MTIIVVTNDNDSSLSINFHDKILKQIFIQEEKMSEQLSSEQEKINRMVEEAKNREKAQYDAKLLEEITALRNDIGTIKSWITFWGVMGVIGAVLWFIGLLL